MKRFLSFFILCCRNFTCDARHEQHRRAAAWAQVGRGGRTNVLVNQAAGPYLERASKEGRKRAHTAEPIAVKVLHFENVQASKWQASCVTL